MGILLYLDPASTSAILYVIIAGVITLIFTLKGFFYKVKNLILGKGFISQNEFKNADIIFYSEGKQYWNVFYPIIKSLNNKNVECVYLSSDKDDPGLKYDSNLCKTKYLGNITMTSVFLNKLDAKFVGMTTPQLDVMMLKKSKKVNHYAHIVHAPTDVFSYRKFAFDYFDSVFCSGPHQVKGLRKLEEIRHIKPKLLLETGLTYFDVLNDDLKNTTPEISDKKVVLVAPTWKEYSIINRFGISFFENLLENTNFEVILRPHPQSYISFPKLIQEIELEFKNEARFTVDTNRSGTVSMQKADLMISDLSGVIWDFAFLYSKQVLLLDTDTNSMLGFEGSELDYEMWEMKERKKLGRSFSEKDINNIGEIVIEMLNNPISTEIEELKNESVYNFGNAGEVAANQIIDILKI